MENSQNQVLNALNSIVKGIKFTMEDFSDFKDGKLPTLDFALEISEQGNLQYTFYENPMQSKWVTPESLLQVTRIRTHG